MLSQQIKVVHIETKHKKIVITMQNWYSTNYQLEYAFPNAASSTAWPTFILLLFVAFKK